MALTDTIPFGRERETSFTAGENTPSSQERDTLLKQAEEAKEQIKKLQKEVKKLQGSRDNAMRCIYVFIAIGIAGFVWYKRQYDRLSQQQRAMDDRLHKLEEKLAQGGKARPKESSGVQTKTPQSGTGQTKTGTQSEPPSSLSPAGPGEREVISDPPSSHGHPKTAAGSDRKNKYFSLSQNTDGTLFVAERKLKDDSSKSWFYMSLAPGQAEAEFYINEQVTDSILADIPTLRLCTGNAFDARPQASRIRVSKPGKIRKEGQYWMVTEKIEIELI